MPSDDLMGILNEPGSWEQDRLSLGFGFESSWTDGIPESLGWPG